MGGTVKVVVDTDRCVGHGVCEQVAPDIFAVGDDAISQVLVDPVPGDRRAAVAEAVASCPSQALRITE